MFCIEIVVRMRIEYNPWSFQKDILRGFVSSNLQELYDHCILVTLTPFYPLMHHAPAGMYVGARLIVFPFTQNRTHCRVPAMLDIVWLLVTPWLLKQLPKYLCCLLTCTATCTEAAQVRFTIQRFLHHVIFQNNFQQYSSCTDHSNFYKSFSLHMLKCACNKL